MTDVRPASVPDDTPTEILEPVPVDQPDTPPASVDPPIAVAPRRRGPRVLALVAVLAVLAAAGTTTVVLTRHRHGATGPLANQRPGKLPQAPASGPVTVAGADGSIVSCPTGAVPAIALGGGTFTPKLVNGQLLGRGRYRIRVTGIVQNESSAAILIHAIRVSIDGQPWSATVTVKPRLDAQSSTDVVIDGTYQSPSTGTPKIHTDLDWAWQSAQLEPCGAAGLIEDD